jgi:hypothetical protein
MLKIFKRPSQSHPAHANPSSPLDRLISLWFSSAHAEHATAIVIGMPRDLPPSVGPEHADAFREYLTVDDRPIVAAEETDAQRALTMSSRLKSTAKWLSVPVWMRIDGELQVMPMRNIPIGVHFALLCLLQDRLLSLDASEEHPKPMRFIEYDSDVASERCFAEVELWLDEDNTTRIEILKQLRLPRSVRAVPSVY